MSEATGRLNSWWPPALVLLALATPVAAECPPGAALLLSAANCEALARDGEVYITYRLDDGSKDTRGIVAKLLEARPEVVWSLVTDNDNFEQFFCSVAQSDLDPETGINRQVLKVPFWADVEYRVRIANTLSVEGAETVRRSAWTYVDGDLETTSGSWTLREHGEGTLVLYEVVTDPGFGKRWIYTPNRAETELRKLLADLAARSANPEYRCP